MVSRYGCCEKVAAWRDKHHPAAFEPGRLTAGVWPQDGPSQESTLKLAVAHPFGEGVVLYPVVPIVHPQHQVGIAQSAQRVL